MVQTNCGLLINNSTGGLIRYEPAMTCPYFSGYVFVSLVLFVLARISPYEWDNPYPCIEEPDELINQVYTHYWNKRTIYLMHKVYL